MPVISGYSPQDKAVLPAEDNVSDVSDADFESEMSDLPEEVSAELAATAEQAASELAEDENRCARCAVCVGVPVTDAHCSVAVSLTTACRR